MKNLIIIDNFNKENQKFEDRFRNSLEVVSQFFKIEWLHYSKLSDQLIFNRALKADGVILSGSYEMASNHQVIDKYQQVIKLINSFKKPILGICFGLQLIATTYQAQIQKIDHPDYDIENEKAIELNFNGIFPLIDETKIWVYETHHQEVIPTSEFLSSFNIHASSAVCKIQAISHKKLPIYGVQFHPENPKHTQAMEDGKNLLKKFVELI